MRLQERLDLVSKDAFGVVKRFDKACSGEGMWEVEMPRVKLGGITLLHDVAPIFRFFDY